MVAYGVIFQVSALEHDALEVLSLVRSMKNSVVPVNRIPPEILSLILDYLEGRDKDKNLIKLTHVCRSWRDIFISHSSLWTRLDFKDVDKTRVYIERSKSVPLDIHFPEFYQKEASLLVIPHTHRLKTLLVLGFLHRILPFLVEHFSCPLPLFDKLMITPSCYHGPALPDQLFNGNLSSLRELTLAGVNTPLPWRDLSNLTTFNLRKFHEDEILLSQLLDFFESAPYLRHIRLDKSSPSSCDAPSERVVSLPHLKDLSIITERTHSALFDHLSIPAGAFLYLEFDFYDEHRPISSRLSKFPGSLRNLSHITAVNLCFAPNQRLIRLNGQSGELHMIGNCLYQREHLDAGISEVIQFLSQFDVLRTRWLAITQHSYLSYEFAEPTVYQTIHRMKDLRTIMLTQCKSLPFIHTLNPDKDPSKTILCLKLEEIILYICDRDPLHVDELVDMARERALRGVKLSVIKIFCENVPPLVKEAFLPLAEHVELVEYGFDDALPRWDILPS